MALGLQAVSPDGRAARCFAMGGAVSMEQHWEVMILHALAVPEVCRRPIRPDACVARGLQAVGPDGRAACCCAEGEDSSWSSTGGYGLWA